MNRKTLSREWVIAAQKLLLSLRDIVGASITVSQDEETVSEINILAEGHRPPKQIVRDVRSALRAEYQVDMDYRKISVAQRRAPESETGFGLESPTVLTLPASQVSEEPAASRVRFGGVHVGIDQSACKVKVELSLGDRAVVGEAVGSSSGREVPQLVCQATLDAVAKFLDPVYSFSLAGVHMFSISGEETVSVLLKFFNERAEKTLTGSCLVSNSLQQAVVYATLSGLNRILGRLRYRESIEYVLRPSVS